MPTVETQKEILTEAESKALFERIVSMTSGGGETTVSIESQWSGSVRWARNRAHIASDVGDLDIRITRNIRGASGEFNTTRSDDEGLQQAVREAETMLSTKGEWPEQIEQPFVMHAHLTPTLWSDDTYDLGAERRIELAQEMIAGAEAANLVSAGLLRVAARGTAVFGTRGLARYYPETMVECSTTVRDAKGTASGWAGINHYDLARVDPGGIASRALEKCLESRDPVAVEPGRYTAILEPQAVADLFAPIMDQPISRVYSERPAGPFGGERPGTNKITERVLDRRLVLRADPMEPDGGFLPFDRDRGDPYQPVNWIDEGILRELEYNRGYAVLLLHLEKALPNSGSFKLMPAPGVPTSTVEEMIERTRRGVLVTRLSGTQVIHGTSMLTGGYTRDGTWFIENGKITKPVKNFRIYESPLFVLNSLEEVGVPQRVHAPPGLAYMAPAVRVRDFNFAGLADAI